MRSMDWVKLTILILIVAVLLLAIVSCEPVVFFPEEGEWYCEELQLQVCFDPTGECWVMEDGEKVPCGCGADSGSKWLGVGYLQDMGKEVFLGEFVSLEDDRLVLRENLTDIEYTFVRVAEEEETK